MASEPVCENGGSCVSSPPGYNCTCADGFTGTNCEAEIGKSGFHLVNIPSLECTVNYILEPFATSTHFENLQPNFAV